MKIKKKLNSDFTLAILLVFGIFLFAGIKEGFLIDGGIGGFFHIEEIFNGKEELDICYENHSFEPIVYFCPKDDCFNTFSYFVNESDDIKCAFYDLDKEIFEIFENKANIIMNLTPIKGAFDGKSFSISLVLEDSNCIECEFCTCDYGSALMHNKFCVSNGEVVLTGSTNPTANGFFKNNNNMIFVKSKCLARGFGDEFVELKNGILGKGERTENIRVVFQDGKSVESYFCPEDGCQDALVDVLEGSKEVCFATFSFTDEKVAQSLINVKLSNGDVFGTIEKRNANSLGSVFSFLNQSIDVRVDSNSNSMHHKIFVIDRNIVVTGSYNPTKNGNTRNDENMIIIYDNETATKYFEECERIYEGGV
jgi:phosphatidylserine/phosphatidylglycerophosphate/cardiolipin synthase-like enzyme